MGARERSRSPKANYGEVIQLVVDREKARQAKDFTSADDLRSRLSSLGVTLFDKSNSWKAEDGHSGRIPTWMEIEGPAAEEKFISEEEQRIYGTAQSYSAERDVDSEEGQIRALIQEREAARAAKDWSQSDKIRDELKALEVEIFDKEKMWRSKSGFAGCIIGYKGSTPTDLEITTLVLQRERARQTSDYPTADMIRDELKQVRVDIDDKSKVWRCADGRQGPVPTWQGIAGPGPELPPAPAPMARMHSRPPQASLEDQIMEAALRAARNPATAARALQMLNAINAGAPMAPMSHAANLPSGLVPSRASRPAPPRPAPPRPPARGPPPRSGTGVRDALAFISECQGNAPRDEEIEWLVELREGLRQQKDFNGADEIRNAMRTSLGIELFEKEKRWQASDGRQGAIPMWSSLNPTQ